MKIIVKSIYNLSPWIFTILICMVLFVGWRLRHLDLITPEHGLGYLFGIIGTILFGYLLLYSLRKRMRFMEVTGNIQMWFGAHMVIGILFPVLILFHSNFRLGALNSNVALFTMLIVASSGIAGRFFYRKIHHGLYGERANMIALKKDFEEYMGEAGQQFAHIPGVKEELFAFVEKVLVPANNLSQGIIHFCTTRWRAQRTFWSAAEKAGAYLKQFAAEHHWGFMRRLKMQRQIERKTKGFIAQAIKVAEFNLYERLFALWHVLHIPLVFILFLAVVVHIVAVNLY